MIPTSNQHSEVLQILNTRGAPGIAPGQFSGIIGNLAQTALQDAANDPVKQRIARMQSQTLEANEKHV